VRPLLALLLALLPIGAAAAQPRDETEVLADLIAAQGRVVESTRAYRASLEPVLAFQEAAVGRAARRAAEGRELLERGIVSRREVEEADRAAATAQAQVDETRRRMAEADALLGETLAAMELARMPRAVARAPLVATPAVIRYQGDGALDVPALEAFFAERFGRSLPVSARGQTAVHDHLGLDHRNAIDVAVHPDSAEGRALIAYLERHHVPFLAFRQPIPGTSTGAHVHVGPLSPRIVPVKGPGR